MTGNVGAPTLVESAGAVAGSKGFECGVIECTPPGAGLLHDTRTCQDSCMARHYMGMGEVAAFTGLSRHTLNGYAAMGLLPAPDVTVGEVRGWSVATIERWQANRPGRGARTDLKVAGSKGKK